MNDLNNILKEDFENILTIPCIKWDLLKDKTVLVTGASGLIGSNIINSIIYANETRNYNIKVIAVVRNIAKTLNKLISKELNSITFITSDIEEFKTVDGKIDYIIHAANPTSSKFFVEKPVETISTAIIGTKNLLEIARDKKVNSFVFLSSMEIYGKPRKGEDICEDYIAGFDSNIVRNCYPMSKKLCESLCKAYYSEYGVPAKTIRLTQTFGPGVEYSDGRIFAEFMRCVIEKKDIVLKTKGETERCYLYTADAVSAILTVLLNGKNGESYNAANPSTYCSIAEMAQLVSEKLSKDSIKISYQLEDVKKLGYADTLYMNLNVAKLYNLGWVEKYDLRAMFKNMIQTVKHNE